MGRMNRKLSEYMSDADLYGNLTSIDLFMNQCHTLKSAVEHFCSLDKITPAHYAKLYASVIKAINIVDEKLAYICRTYGKEVKRDAYNKRRHVHYTEYNLQLTEYGLKARKGGLALRKELQNYLGMLDKKFNEQFVRK